jgi:hypothetical protein
VKVSSLEKLRQQLLQDNDDLSQQLQAAHVALRAAEKRIKQLDKAVMEWRSRKAKLSHWVRT